MGVFRLPILVGVLATRRYPRTNLLQSVVRWSSLTAPSSNHLFDLGETTDYPIHAASYGDSERWQKLSLVPHQNVWSTQLIMFVNKVVSTDFVRADSSTSIDVP